LIYAFSPEGLARLAATLASRPLLAFDIDGTLAPIVERREQARLPDDVQQCLAALARLAPVAIITGRSVGDARRMLSFEPHYLIGNHGAEGLPGMQRKISRSQRIVRRWRDALDACEGLARTGVEIEDKRYSLSLHYRRAGNPAAAHAAIRDCVAALAPPPRVIVGKAVINLLAPGAFDKGDALRALMAQTQGGGVLYVGDDDTDETVFKLHLPDVLTLRVEPAADSAAALYLRDQLEVLALMRHIAQAIATDEHSGEEVPAR
jgi:trehalose 6-phosphate phosphatase